MDRPSYTARRLTTAERRAAIGWAHVNGGLWGLGSGLAGTTLFTYLAIEYGASGFKLSMLFAAPRIVGLLRLATPAWLKLVGDRRRFTVGMFIASATVLLALPVASAPGMLPSTQHSLWALIGCWTLYHLLEFFAVVALWSWLRDLTPTAIRGRFVGRREAWLNAGRVSGMLLAAAYTLWWELRLEPNALSDLKWLGFAACAAVGALLMMAAVVPLLRMPNVSTGASEAEIAASRVSLGDLTAPLADPQFRKFLFYGVWFSAANGIVQSAQRIFTAYTLDISLAQKRVLDASSRGAQSFLMPWIGQTVDRRGNVTVLAWSQAFVAAATVFFLIATPTAKWWIVGAYICWIAYSGTNVAQPNLMLGLSPADRCPAYAAAWFAWTQLVYAICGLAGGLLLDWLADHLDPLDIVVNNWEFDRFAAIFTVGLLLKLVCVFWAARIPEPLAQNPARP